MPQAQSEYLPGDPLSLIRRGWMGFDQTETYYQQLREAIAPIRTGAAGYLGRAAGRAGYVPQDLAARLSAIKGVGEQKIAATLAANMSASQQARAMGALERYYRDYQFQQQLEAQEAGLWAQLGGGLISSLITLGGILKFGNNGQPQVVPGSVRTG